MPTNTAVDINGDSLQNILNLAKGPKHLRIDSRYFLLFVNFVADVFPVIVIKYIFIFHPLNYFRLVMYAEKLLNEVKLDYQRSMNKITFDKVVSENPERFSFVVIEEKPLKLAPDSGF